MRRHYTIRKNRIIYKKEDPLITQILQFLGNMGIMAWRNNTTGYYDVKQKRYRKFHNQRKGIADILGILRDGKLLAIETKTRNTRRTKDQELFIEDVDYNNGIALFAKSLDDVIDILISTKYLLYDGIGYQYNSKKDKRKRKRCLA